MSSSYRTLPKKVEIKDKYLNDIIGITWRGVAIFAFLLFLFLLKIQVFIMSDVKCSEDEQITSDIHLSNMQFSCILTQIKNKSDANSN